tara:strand:+ start:170 stop:1642 length:1473 start_codon:yes stop_codon:yes gene_type:complete
MNDKIIKILKIASNLEDNGFSNEANQLDKCAENLDFIKQAQYDGVQGYWVRNSRCWQNCYRQKRSSSPDKPIQEVWSECHGEFVGSLYGSDSSDWGKYADSNFSDIKVASLQKMQSIDVQFNKLIDTCLEDGDTIEEAVAGAIIKQCSSYTDLVSEVTVSMLKVADSIKDYDIKKSIDLVDIGDFLTKEAKGFWGGLMDTLKGGFQYGREAISDSRSRGVLSRLSNKTVYELEQIFEWVKSYNKVVESAIESAKSSSKAPSARLRDAANETIRILSAKGIKFNERVVFTALNQLRKLPYSKHKEKAPFGSETESPRAEEGIPSTPDAPRVDEEVAPPTESEPRSVKEYVAANIGIAKEIARKLLRAKYSTGGRGEARDLLKSLGLKGAFSNTYNLSKQAQFVDSDKKEWYERKIRDTRSTRRDLYQNKLNKMNSLAKKDFDQFLIAIMAKLGTVKFTEFINEAVGRTRGKGGKFKPITDDFPSPAPGPIT